MIYKFIYLNNNINFHLYLLTTIKYNNIELNFLDLKIIKNKYVKFGEIEGCKIGCGAVQVTENGLDKNAK